MYIKSITSCIQPMWVSKVEINTTSFRLKFPIISASTGIIWEKGNITSIHYSTLKDIWKTIKTPTMCKVQMNYIRKTADTVISQGWKFERITLHFRTAPISDFTAGFYRSKQKQALWHHSLGCSQKCHLLESSNSKRAVQQQFCVWCDLVINYPYKVFS